MGLCDLSIDDADFCDEISKLCVCVRVCVHVLHITLCIHIRCLLPSN